MINKRKTGVLMHISSLPGDYSVGSFGDEAIEFIDRLSEGGFSFWQVLPFSMADECNSPYKSYSAFGANPYFIDIPTLFEKGYIEKEDLDKARQKDKHLCEYDRLAKERISLLKKAAEKMREDSVEVENMYRFLGILDEFDKAAKFLALKEKNNNAPWYEWTEDTPDESSLFTWRFIQYEFFVEWMKIKSYANAKGIKIIGDVPIYVAHDSADVWSNPKNFLLDEDNMPSAVAGVPPDYFSEDGQLWNNPLYNWDYMKKEGYSFWTKRIEYMLTLFDGVRIDHFRAFESYYSIPRGESSAKNGRWVPGPGKAIIDKIKSTAEGALIIAEDLGDITDEVYALLDYSGFPGMRVFQFAFLGDEATPHLPHNFIKNCIAYSGTHDNNTLLGYVWEADRDTRRRIFDYCGYSGEDFTEGSRSIVRTLYSSVADTVIFPIQDLLLFGADTRMNTPGTSDGNWSFRITREQLQSLDMRAHKKLASLYSRRKKY